MTHSFTQFTGHVDERHPSGSPASAHIGYDALVTLIGEPNSSDDPCKTDAAWDLEHPTGRVHIYNYKNGPHYNNIDPEDMEDWTDEEKADYKPLTLSDINEFHLRGDTQAAVDAFLAMVKEATA